MDKQLSIVKAPLQENYTLHISFHLKLQFPTEELVKEVENSIAEFKRHKQEYDEDRVREQVRGCLDVFL